MKIVLDALKLQTKSEAHAYLKEMFQFPEYYGSNLDALYDCLTDLGTTQVQFINEDEGDHYYKKIRRVFADACKANPDLTVGAEEETGDCPENSDE